MFFNVSGSRTGVDPECCAAAVFCVALENLVEPGPGVGRAESQGRSAVRSAYAIAQHPCDIGVAMHLDAGNIGLRGVPRLKIPDQPRYSSPVYDSPKLLDPDVRD